MNIKKKRWPIETAFVIIAVLLVYFFLSLFLFSERCGFTETEPIKVIEGIGQIVGPTRQYICDPAIVALPEKWLIIVGISEIVIWPIILIILILGTYFQYKYNLNE